MHFFLALSPQGRRKAPQVIKNQTMKKILTINKNKGFSLIELSIVLIIIAVLIGLISFSIQTRIDAARLYTTKERMKLIANAIDAYYLQYGVLPCGAPSVGRDEAYYGFSKNVDYDANPTSLCDDDKFGRDVPFKVLGLDSATIADGWGNRFAYFWTGNYARINYVDDDAIADGTTNFNQLRNFSGGDEQDMAYVLLSLGANGYGAIDDKTNTRNNTGAMRDPENSNAEAVADSSTPEPATRMHYSEGVDFDDIMVYRLKPNMPEFTDFTPASSSSSSFTYRITIVAGDCSDLAAQTSLGYGGTNVGIVSYDCDASTITVESAIDPAYVGYPSSTDYVKGYPGSRPYFGIVSLLN
jgi:prepilin-type N-terminal cleavage/methylation domain-containing protein